MAKAATVGNLNWGGCGNCIHNPPETGGCELNMPDDINNFVISYDFIECHHFEERSD